MDALDINQFKCYNDFDTIPENLNQQIVGRGDITGHYFIPNTNTYTHHMNFTANDLNDIIRIQVIRAKTVVAIYEESLNGEPLAKSRSDFMGKR